MKHYRLIPIPLCLLLLAGCSSPIKQTEPSLTESASEPIPTEKPATASSNGLTSGIVYDTLAAEIAAQRGEHQQAFHHAFKAAQQSRDPAAAERATHLAIHANLTTKALKALQLWIEISPESLKAHQLAALLYTKQRDLTEATYHLQQVTMLANQRGQNGYIQAAAIAEKAGSPKQALALMQQVIPAGTRDPEALYALALTANHAKQYQLSEQTIRQALESKPDWPNGVLLLSRTLTAQDKKEEGLSVLRDAVDNFPKNFELRLTYARALVEAQQLENALTQFEHLDKVDRDNPDIIYALGVITTELQQYPAANRYFNRLLKLQKKQGDAHYYLGLIAEQTDKPDQALSRYGKVEGRNQADARIRMARIQATQGKLDTARETLQQLRIKSPQHGLRLYLIEAELARDTKAYSTAHEIYTQALDIYEGDLDLLYARALNAAELGRIDILETDLNKILITQPDHADALNALGYTLADQTDRLEEARSYIQKAMVLKPNNAAILDSMGWVEYRSGNLREALNYLQQAYKLNPDAEIASHLGEVLWKLDQKPQALKVWKSANEKNPDNRFIIPTMQRLGADISDG